MLSWDSRAHLLWPPQYLFIAHAGSRSLTATAIELRLSKLDERQVGIPGNHVATCHC